MSRPRPFWPRSHARLPRSWAHAITVVHAAARAATPALRTWCLPVTTSKLGHDPVLEISSSHSSLCLAQNFFFQNPPLALLPLVRPYSPKKKKKLLLPRCSSLTLQITKNPRDLYSSQFKELNYSPFSCAKTGIIFQNSIKHNLFIFKNWNDCPDFIFFRLILDYFAQNSQTPKVTFSRP